MARGGEFFVVNIFSYLCGSFQDDSIAVTIDTFE